MNTIMEKEFVLKELPVGAVLPQGMTKRFLETQMHGLTGRIEEAGPPFDTPKWSEERITEEGVAMWWEYEQYAYWLDGFVRAAVLLQDRAAIARAESLILSVIRNPDRDGYLGPRVLKEANGWNRWPHVVFFRACIALYDGTGNEKILHAICRHYLGSATDFTKKRDVLNVEIMLWAYGKSGERRLLELAEETYAGYNTACGDCLCDRAALGEEKPYAHGVSYNEFFKLGAVLYLHTGKEGYLATSRAAYRKLERYFSLPSGCHCSDEFLISDDYMHGYETCDISDYTWNSGYLLAATGEGGYADRIEKCVFNAGIGSVLEDFRGLQYFSFANQTIADATSNHAEFFRGGAWASYRPVPGTECCTGNVNRFMPNYVARQYFTDRGGNVYSALFGESVYDHGGVRIEQKTDYPFDLRILWRIHTEREFVLFVRIPAWSQTYEVMRNGQAVKGEPKSGFMPVSVSEGDEVSLVLTAEPVRHESKGGVWFSRGPLVYSLGIPTKKIARRSEKRPGSDFPDYDIYPAGEWAYGVERGSRARFVDGVSREWRLADGLPHLTVRGRKLKNWDYERCDSVVRTVDLLKEDTPKEKISGKFVFTPRNPSSPEAEGDAVELRLYPYGVCKLRITVLPLLP